MAIAYIPHTSGSTGLYAVLLNPQTNQVWDKNLSAWATKTAVTLSNAVFDAVEGELSGSKKTGNYFITLPSAVDNQPIHAVFYKQASPPTYNTAVDTQLGIHAHEPSLYYQVPATPASGSFAAGIKTLRDNAFLTGVVAMNVEQFKTAIFTTPTTGFSDCLGSPNKSLEEALCTVASGAATINAADIDNIANAVLSTDVTAIADPLTISDFGRHSLAASILLQTNADSKTVTNAVVLRNPDTDAILHQYTVVVGAGQPIQSIT